MKANEKYIPIIKKDDINEKIKDIPLDLQIIKQFLSEMECTNEELLMVILLLVEKAYLFNNKDLGDKLLKIARETKDKFKNKKYNCHNLEKKKNYII